MKLGKCAKKLLYRLTVKLGLFLYEANDTIAFKTLPQFGNNPKNLRIDFPRRIINPARIFIGDNVMFGPGSFLFALTHYPGISMQNPEIKQEKQIFDSKIEIGHRVTATGGLQVTSQSKIIIEDDVMFASNVFINDAFHGYKNAAIPYKYQQLWKIKPIVIKTGSWIGQNAVILPGVTIGALSIIGANSVVTKSVPEKCIAAGIPAKVLKRWDESANCWIPAPKVNNSEKS